MKNNKTEIGIKGKTVHVASFIVEEKEIVVTGRFVRIARIKGEFFGEDLQDPESFIRGLNGKDLKADLFTFWQGLPGNKFRMQYYMEMDNIAAIPITSYDHWLKNQTNRMVRKNIRISMERGIKVLKSDFNDELILGIQGIFNEIPVRQGKRFWHYGKDPETVRKEMGRDLDRSEFIGAYLNGELIGFAKVIFTKEALHFAQILSKIEHRDKKPNNALIAMAVRICEEQKIPYLSYGSFVYGTKGEDPLSEFKKHNGFVKIELPRYYVPLNRKGELALKLKLHRNIIDLIPKNIVNAYLEARAWLYSK